MLDLELSIRSQGQQRPTVEHNAFTSLAEALLDQIECGLVVCHGNGRLVQANRAGHRELDGGSVLKIVDDTVRCPANTADFAAALHDAANRQRRRLLWLGDEADRLMIVAMPISVEGSSTPTALVMLGRRSLCSPLGLEMLAIRHGLTLAERRVLKGLIANQSASQIAVAHGVGLPTVRTQIQSVREKVGVRSIDELLLHAAQVPPVSSWYECRGDA